MKSHEDWNTAARYAWDEPTSLVTRGNTVLLNLLLVALVATSAKAVTIETVFVGNPGNKGEKVGNVTLGGVEYVYRIGKYEVTNAEYVEFLNAVDPTGTNRYGLYKKYMSTDANGGVDFNRSAVRDRVKPARSDRVSKT